MAKVLVIIPPERFRDEELFVTKSELEKAGHKITIGSTKLGKCPGSRGGYAESTILLSNVKVDSFDCLIFVGGGGSKLLFNDNYALQIAKEAHKKGKVLAAICLAPVILANAGVLNGAKATVAGTEADTISSKGAIYTGPGVTVDKNIVTANGPKSSQLFGQEISQLLAK